MRLLVLVMSVLVCCRAATIAARIRRPPFVFTSVLPTSLSRARKSSWPARRTGRIRPERRRSSRRPGTVEITVVKPGFAPATASVQVAAGATQDVVVELQPQPTLEETVTVVASTRTDKRLEDQPMRVEVLDREEIEEKMLMTPGDIVMMLNEMGGMRVQTTSPSLGAASVRIQGMRGRYTRVLSDGLPLFGDVGGLGLLQIPPMDLGQVEVIKGVASALYGAGAMGGVVNLLSRRPGSEHAGGVPVQSLDARCDGRGGLSLRASVARLERLATGRRTLAGDQRRERRRVGRSRRVCARGRTAARVLGWRQRPDVLRDDGLHVRGPERRHAGRRRCWRPPVSRTSKRWRRDRYDAGAVGQFLFKRPIRDDRARRGRAAEPRPSVWRSAGTRSPRYGRLAKWRCVERRADRRGSAGSPSNATPTRRAMCPGSTTPSPCQAPSFSTTSPRRRHLSLSSSARLDVHSEYGTFFSPRLSALAHAGRWTSRLSVGTGFFGPTPITEETEAAGLTRLEVRQPLEAERGLSASFDLSRTDGPLSYTATVFASRIKDPMHVERSPSYVLSTLPDPTTNVGLELLGTLRKAPFSVTATYTYVRARETVDAIEQDVPLTPRHSAGIVGMWEAENVGRVGIEWYCTGRQSLEENPYRAVSEPYMILGLLAEKQFGRIRLFINGENLTGVRQTRWDPLLLPTRAVDGRWTVDAWAPLEGRNINGGLRVRF